ncbi:hypothetical protein LTR62_006814 [Meristemomyces frigidus]|uniref:Endonuclease/exonuclease/phosphatase domain-containing protein n=1 Tax=Meristemomyces frigidus TaxID=1508187 RepID=A0AAN7YMR2_9PEZI|nr:hypothetical protein LTR62_006814 [Meristemomyces frigidus]
MSCGLLTTLRRALTSTRTNQQSKMDMLVKQSIEIVQRNQRTTVPWKPDEPYAQPCYTWTGIEWQALTTSKQDGSKPSPRQFRPSCIALYSWNIDFMLPFPDSRMRLAVRHLEGMIAKQPASTATIVHLNECLASDIKLLKSNFWIRENFKMTDVDTSNWQSGHYGTTTLIDKRLELQSCFRVHYSKTYMERDALFVDINIDTTAKPLRFCNTHAESLANEPAFRPPQIALCASYMRDPSVHGAVLAGDLNAIQPFDKHLHADNELQDAYLETGGDEDDEEGHTWGQQAATVQRQRFGTSRMDKVFYCGDVVCTLFERFGMDVEVEDDAERKEIMELGFEKAWVTDHLGVMAVFDLNGMLHST